MTWLLIIVLLADPVSVTVIEGTLKTKEGEVKVKGGTFIPSPADKKLAKEIVDKNREITKLNIQIDTWQMKFQKLDEYWQSRENKILNFYQEDNVRLKNEIKRRDNWWNQWGKTTLVSLGAAAVAAYVTYEAVK